MNKRILAVFIIVVSIGIGVFAFQNKPTLEKTNNGGPVEELNPLSIEYMRKQKYPGSDIVIKQTLPDEEVPLLFSLDLALQRSIEFFDKNLKGGDKDEGFYNKY